MVRNNAVLWVLVLIISSMVPGVQAQVTSSPTLVLPNCPGAQFYAGDSKCFPIMLDARGTTIASIGFTLQYDTAALGLPNGSVDVQKGGTLGPQSFSAVINENGVGSAKVIITPPLQIPVPTIADGEIAKVCFTAKQDAPDGCTVLSFTAVDMGDEQGSDVPVDPPGNGGIAIGTIIVDPPRLGHFQCYKAKTASRTPKFESRNVHLTDQFETRITTVTKPEAICNPADKNGEGAADFETHLESYQIRDAKVCSDSGNPCSNAKDCAAGARCVAPKHTKRRNILVKNQFGTIVVDTIKPERLLVPTAKDENNPVDAPDPVNLKLDHFRCYKVRVNKNIFEDDPKVRCRTDVDCAAAGVTGVCNTGFPNDLSVTIADQFIDPLQVFTVKKPTKLCNPVDKNSEGIKDLENHLMCYQVKLARKVCRAGAPSNELGSCRNEQDCGGDRRQTSWCKPQTKFEKVAGLHTNNQFGPERLDASKEDELCVPSEKILPQPD